MGERSPSFGVCRPDDGPRVSGPRVPGSGHASWHADVGTPRPSGGDAESWAFTRIAEGIQVGQPDLKLTILEVPLAWKSSALP